MTTGAVGPQLGGQMEAEMAEQPERLAALFARRAEIASQVNKAVPHPLAGTCLVARGSSDHAATCGAYLLEMGTRRPVALSSPSVLTLYKAGTDFSGYLVIAVSQSGRTPEIVEVAETMRRRGACTVAFTNDTSSPLAMAAEIVVGLGAGEERAVPATKTVTAQLAAFAIVAGALGDIGITDSALDDLPGQVAGLLEDAGPPQAVAQWLAGAPEDGPGRAIVTCARGILYGAAREVALKLEETTSRFTAGYSAADLRHGPIAIAASGASVLAFAHPGPTSDDVTSLVAEVRDRGARARLAGPLPGSSLTWPASAPEPLASVLAVVRGQQIALALARLDGRDPDAPPGLSKVTVT
jgi:glutamine---fructose-6-phosphate transaminase (isomerizing)